MKLFNFLKKLFKIQENTRNSLKDKSSLESFLLSTLGFETKNVQLYKTAFTHPSITKKTNENYERLEFLGDAFLGAIIAEKVYAFFPDESEGKLSIYRAQLVNRKMLNNIAEKLNFKNHIIASEQAKKSNSILGNTLEAFIGALYIDQGFLKTAHFIENSVLKYMELKDLPNQIISYKSKLIEMVVKQKKDFKYKIISENGFDHSKKYTIGFYLDNNLIDSDFSSSKKKAEEKVSEKIYKSELLKEELC